jgi:hypothetical protein
MEAAKLTFRDYARAVINSRMPVILNAPVVMNRGFSWHYSACSDIGGEKV